jgi:hypothetical protein
LVVVGISKKDALKKADQYMVPQKDTGGNILIVRVDLKRSPILLSEIIKEDPPYFPELPQDRVEPDRGPQATGG